MNLQILCFNIHKGVGWGKYKSTLHHIKNQIIELQPDIIFLQEVLSHQFAFLTSHVGPHFSYGRNAVYQKGHQGNAILSKFPILSSKNIDLTTRPYEKRGLLHSKVQLPHEKNSVHLFCVHLALREKDRRKQLDQIATYIRDNTRPEDRIILAGDFNDWTGYATQPLIEGLDLTEGFLHLRNAYAKTYPARLPMLRLDRVYFRGFRVTQVTRLTKKPWRYFSDHIALVISLQSE